MPASRSGKKGKIAVTKIVTLKLTLILLSVLDVVVIGRRRAHYISSNTISTHLEAERATVTRILYGIEI